MMFTLYKMKIRAISKRTPDIGAAINIQKGTSCSFAMNMDVEEFVEILKKKL